MLSDIKSTTKVRRMVFLDTETHGEPTNAWKGTGKPKLHLLRLGWMVTWDAGDEEWHYFTTADEFFSILEKFISAEREQTYIYSYNSSFDFQILGVLKRIREREGWSLMGSPIFKPFMIQAKYKYSTAWFLDMGNHLGVKLPLSEIGKGMNILKGDLDRKHLDDYPDEDVAKYCKRDTEIVRNYMLEWFRFLKDNDLGPYRPSLAAQCLTTFRHKFIDVPIWVHHHPFVSQVERKSYKGGRNEAFFIGEVPYAYKLDVNSFHPFIMSSLPLPYKLKGTISHPRTRTLQSLLDNDRAFIVDGKVWTPEPVISVRRVVAPHIERTIFPVGSFPATITSMEYRQLLGVGGKMIEADVACVYDVDILFKSYIDFFYKKRLEFKASGDKTRDSMSKYFMNSLEGKFAQHVPMSTEINGKSPINGQVANLVGNEDNFEIKEYGGKTYVYTKTKKDSVNTFTAISSFIRAYTRVMLWEDFNLIRNAGGRVFYCDTDSIFCDKAGYKALSSGGRIDDKRLGAYKKEDEGTLTIYGAKDYLFNGKKVIKGIREDAVQDGDSFKQTYFERMQGMMRRNIEEGVIIVDDFEKRPTRIYRKGTVSDSGWVKPLFIDE